MRSRNIKLYGHPFTAYKMPDEKIPPALKGKGRLIYVHQTILTGRNSYTICQMPMRGTWTATRVEAPSLGAAGRIALRHPDTHGDFDSLEDAVLAVFEDVCRLVEANSKTIH